MGIDPGSTSALAIVDLDGNIIFLNSWRHISRSELIRKIIKQGKPVIVTSDKRKTPSTVQKIASSLGSEVFEPEEDLDSETKRELGNGDNSHEKDASASALNAYNHLQREIRKIEQIAERENVSRDKAAQHYFLDKSLHADDDEEDSTEVDEKDREGEDALERDEEKIRLQSRIENLQEQNTDLKDKISSLEKEKSTLQEKLDNQRESDRLEAIRDQEVSKRDAVISEKKDRIEDLEQQLRESRLRESQYRKAVHKIFNNNFIELVPKREERVIYKGDEYSLDDVEGLELRDFFLLTEKPEPDMKEVLEEFQEGEFDEDGE